MQNAAFLNNYNLRTCENYNTFLGMEIIAVTTLKTEIAYTIPRVKVTAEDITAIAKIRCITIPQI